MRSGTPWAGQVGRGALLRWGAALGLGSLLLAACTGGGGTPSPSQNPTPSDSATQGTPEPVPSPDLAPFYQQALDWTDCEQGMQCAEAVMPLDWAEPAGDTITIALRKLPAADPDARLGSLLVNPGGPGAATLNYMDYFATILGETVRERYDLVGFDPRGVGQSSAVDCGPDEVIDALFLSDEPVDTPEQYQAALAQSEEFGRSCLEHTGELLGHVSTAEVAMDMDALRAALGDDSLTYLGFSYGTYLGAVYAGLFPERVGRMVLDGAMDPAMSMDEAILAQEEGFEAALRSYVADCQAGPDCPLGGDLDDGLGLIRRFMDTMLRGPIPAGEGQTLNAVQASLGIGAALYDQGSWPYLTQAFTLALRNDDGSVLLALSNGYLDRSADGVYLSNRAVANVAVNCLDYPVVERSFAEIQAWSAQVAEVGPTTFIGGGPNGCERWPFAAAGTREPIHATGAAPILVIGTTGDPATPFSWAQALSEQLDSGLLITHEGEGHTVYGYGNACVDEAVDAYLVDGTVPEDGLVC